MKVEPLSLTRRLGAESPGGGAATELRSSGLILRLAQVRAMELE